MNYESFVAHDMCIGTNACEVRDESWRRWRERGREGEDRARAEKTPLRAKDSGWAELLHIIIIIINAAVVVVVIIVVNGVGCYLRARTGSCQSVLQSLLRRLNDI